MTFLVNVENNLSSPGDLTCGVPQGSIRGPLICLLWVSDKSNSVDCDLLLYADHSCLVFTGPDLKTIEANLNKNFNSLCDWSAESKLSIHFGEDKTKPIVHLDFSQATISWYKYYLTNRKFLVNVAYNLSSSGDLTCGVPQGSIFGPLIFLPYVNDMSNSVDCDLLLYADDSCLVLTGPALKTIEANLNKNLNYLCVTGLLKIN